MKKIINDPTTVVAEALARACGLAHADLITVTYEPDFIARADAPVAGKVALVSGGGSGHEPLHGGFVGPACSTRPCPGAVFTSPTPDQVLAATQAVDGGAGVLHIVKNYTGDVLNFETAAELAAAEGIEVSAVVVDDDVAVKDSTCTAGRRGVGGTVLLEKIAGAAAARGDDLAAVTAIAERVIANVRSMGMALTAVHRAALRRAELRPGRRRDGDRHRHPRRARPGAAQAGRRPTRSSRPCWTRSSRTCRSQSGDRDAAVRQRHGRHAAGRALPGLRLGPQAAGRTGASRSPGRWSATTSRAWRCRGCRSPC